MRRLLVSTVSALLTLGLCGAAFAAPVTGQISFSGFAESANSVGMGDATGLNFASGVTPAISGTSGGVYSYGGGSGTFAFLGSYTSGDGIAGTIVDIGNFITEPATVHEVTFNTAGPSVSFDLGSITSVSLVPDMAGGSVTFSATGTVNFSGFDPTPGTLVLTSEGSNIDSFSGTIRAGVPEPASLGILGAAGVMLAFRRRRRGL